MAAAANRPGNGRSQSEDAVFGAADGPRVEPPALQSPIQRAIHPEKPPQIESLDLAVYSRMSQRAGGDFYSFFALPEGRWGMLIADVSGHGPRAAAVMRITHRLVHALPGLPEPPASVLRQVNFQLASRYTGASGAFVTAFYAIFDPASRSLTYARAGHGPPRLRSLRRNTIVPLEGESHFPLGVSAAEDYDSTTQIVESGDQIVFYTDGITEARDPSESMFGVERLDQMVLEGPCDARGMIRSILAGLDQFTRDRHPTDDRTLLVATVL